jgi:hypothetical protein
MIYHSYKEHIQLMQFGYFSIIWVEECKLHHAPTDSFILIIFISSMIHASLTDTG